MNQADKLTRSALIRQIVFQRVAGSITLDLVKELDELADEMAADIVRVDVTGVSRARDRAYRLAKLFDQLEETVAAAMKALAKRFAEDMDELTEVAEEEQRRDWLAYYGLGLAFGPRPAPQVQGVAVPDIFEGMGDALMMRNRIVLRDIIEGQGTPAEMAERVRRRGPTAESPIDQTKRSVETTVRTGADEAVNEPEARSEPKKPTRAEAAEAATLPEESPIAPHGWQHISVLDNRTTETCKQRAWKIWDADKKPVGHSLQYAQPPLHHYCRSKLLLIFLDAPEPARLTFKDFVAQLSPRQREKLFGAKQLELWERGLLADSQLIRQAGRPLELERLRDELNGIRAI